MERVCFIVFIYYDDILYSFLISKDYTVTSQVKMILFALVIEIPI